MHTVSLILSIVLNNVVMLLSILLISSHIFDRLKRRMMGARGRAYRAAEIERVREKGNHPASHCLISRLEKTQTLRGNLHGIGSLKPTVNRTKSREEKERERKRKYERETSLFYSRKIPS